jgi:stearoyl-CoA desaturase (delta-9 desaturase)
MISLGEGWHNNHHYYQSSTRQGFFWWEIDLTYYALKFLSLIGLVWDIREVPAHVQFNQDKLIQTKT